MFAFFMIGVVVILFLYYLFVKYSFDGSSCIVCEAQKKASIATDDDFASVVDQRVIEEDSDSESDIE